MDEQVQTRRLLIIFTQLKQCTARLRIQFRIAPKFFLLIKMLNYTPRHSANVEDSDLFPNLHATAPS